MTKKLINLNKKIFHGLYQQNINSWLIRNEPTRKRTSAQ